MWLSLKVEEGVTQFKEEEYMEEDKFWARLSRPSAWQVQCFPLKSSLTRLPAADFSTHPLLVGAKEWRITEGGV